MASLILILGSILLTVIGALFGAFIFWALCHWLSPDEFESDQLVAMLFIAFMLAIFAGMVLGINYVESLKAMATVATEGGAICA